jgi:hypothetical protein
MVCKSERTLVALGGSIIIAMPKPWILGNGLQAGDKVELIFDDVVTVKPLHKEVDKK